MATNRNEAEEDDRAGEESEGSTFLMHDRTTVPTKTEDGGSSMNGMPTNSDRTRPDAFLLYSDDARRMRAILGMENANDGQDAGVDVTAEGGEGGDQQGQGEHQGTIRKTRLSFEVHDSLFIEMLLNTTDQE